MKFVITEQFNDGKGKINASVVKNTQYKKTLLL